MPSNPFYKLVRARLPPAAVGIESNSASVVQLDRARGGWGVGRAAPISLPPKLVKTTFDQTNINDQKEAARTLERLGARRRPLRPPQFLAVLARTADPT